MICIWFNRTRNTRTSERTESPWNKLFGGGSYGRPMALTCVLYFPLPLTVDLKIQRLRVFTLQFVRRNVHIWIFSMVTRKSAINRTIIGSIRFEFPFFYDFFLVLSELLPTVFPWWLTMLFTLSFPIRNCRARRGAIWIFYPLETRPILFPPGAVSQRRRREFRFSVFARGHRLLLSSIDLESGGLFFFFFDF